MLLSRFPSSWSDSQLWVAPAFLLWCQHGLRFSFFLSTQRSTHSSTPSQLSTSSGACLDQAIYRCCDLDLDCTSTIIYAAILKKWRCVQLNVLVDLDIRPWHSTLTLDVLFQSQEEEEECVRFFGRNNASDDVSHDWRRCEQGARSRESCVSKSGCRNWRRLKNFKLYRARCPDRNILYSNITLVVLWKRNRIYRIIYRLTLYLFTLMYMYEY